MEISDSKRRLVVKKSLWQRALDTDLHSRFIARKEDLGRELTDEEIRNEAQYQLEDLPYKGYEPEEQRKMARQLKALLR